MSEHLIVLAGRTEIVSNYLREHMEYKDYSIIIALNKIRIKGVSK